MLSVLIIRTKTPADNSINRPGSTCGSRIALRLDIHVQNSRLPPALDPARSSGIFQFVRLPFPPQLHKKQHRQCYSPDDKSKMQKHRSKQPYHSPHESTVCTAAPTHLKPVSPVLPSISTDNKTTILIPIINRSSFQFKRSTEKSVPAHPGIMF